ncbi:MAG: histidine triad nucleotide-binding protein [Anaerolineae bacterium UTCFX2]|jgi:histidine triad (HIT) family protein|nr:histidine triad nucleotide-binding protein [Anaerolineae bacterium]MCZ7552669.1 histidine triad nucleotide-binding protein [Anaerolineales bacterium]OQY94212.1 MAG: histidine triad nucleotide-binding protein [Anaerolineae bacterium UTCFX2]
MERCVFCRIITGELPSKQLYHDEHLTAFRDIHPVAPTHILIVPNRHIASLNEAAPEDERLLGSMFTLARQLARQEGIADEGYRLIVNTGGHGGQTIYHLHMHLIGGQRMRHPMG